VDAHSRPWFESCVEGAASTLDKIEAYAQDVRMGDDFWFSADDWRSKFRPYQVKGGVLVIPVKGVLLNDFPWQIYNWATGYEYILAAFKRGLDDPDVKGIAFHIDSPGGMVAGNFDLVDRIYQARGTKPIKAFASEGAYSAAYSIASAADDITVTRSGGVGSVGVVTTHVDYSEAMEDAGVKVTFIFAGKHKVDGNPYAPLPEAVRVRIQDRIDALYEEFTGIVARNRGIEQSAVKKTEAQIFSAAEALDVKFADRIGQLDDEITAFAATFSTKREEDDMAEKQAQFEQADLDSAKAQGVTEGKAQGVSEERARITGILGSEEAKTRPTAAMMLVELGVDAETAATQLAKLQPETKVEPEPKGENGGAGAPKGMLDAAMKGSQHENVGDTDDGDDDKDAAAAAAEESLLLSAGLPGFKTKQSK
jgi:signal peptide peptidase SppA